MLSPDIRALQTDTSCKYKYLKGVGNPVNINSAGWLTSRASPCVAQSVDYYMQMAMDEGIVIELRRKWQPEADCGVSPAVEESEDDAGRLTLTQLSGLYGSFGVATILVVILQAMMDYDCLQDPIRRGNENQSPLSSVLERLSSVNVIEDDILKGIPSATLDPDMRATGEDAVNIMQANRARLNPDMLKGLGGEEIFVIVEEHYLAMQLNALRVLQHSGNTHDRQGAIELNDLQLILEDNTRAIAALQEGHAIPEQNSLTSTIWCGADPRDPTAIPEPSSLGSQAPAGLFSQAPAGLFSSC